MVFDEFPLQGCGRNGDRPLGRAIAQVVAHGPAWAGLGTFKAEGHKFGNGVCWRMRAGSSGNMGIKLRCMVTSGGDATNASALVTLAGWERR